MSCSSSEHKLETRLILRDALGGESDEPALLSNRTNSSPILPESLIYNISSAAEDDENDTIKKIDAILEQGKEIYNDHVISEHGLDNLIDIDTYNYKLEKDITEKIITGLCFFFYIIINIIIYQKFNFLIIYLSCIG
jgi:hypothetical protein